MSTNPSSSRLTATQRLLLAVAIGLPVLGIALFGILDRGADRKSAAQGLVVTKPTSAKLPENDKNPSSANLTAAAAKQPAATAVLPPAPRMPTSTAAESQKVAAATPSTSSQLPQPAVQDNSLIDPESSEPALSPGEEAHLQVTVGGMRTPLLSPNQVGSFPRVYLPLGGQADVQVQLPEAQVGDQVVASIEDGGRFSDGKPVKSFTLDESRQIGFQFQASQSLGTFRVSVRHGAETKVVSFWAGDRALALNH